MTITRKRIAMYESVKVGKGGEKWRSKVKECAPTLTGHEVNEILELIESAGIEGMKFMLNTVDQRMQLEPSGIGFWSRMRMQIRAHYDL